MKFRHLEDLFPEYRAVGGLSSNSKMPGLSWGVPITVCAARKLYADNPASVCSRCYCKRGRMNFRASLAAQRRRLKCYLDDRKAWTRNMISLLRRLRSDDLNTMRWFDSGDLLDREMLDDILRVCRYTPAMRHWISTQDETIVGTIVPDDIPLNTVIRLSAHMLNLPNAQVEQRPGIAHAAVLTRDIFNVTSPASCPAYEGPGPAQCGDCRKYWNRRQPLVVYPLH